MAPGRMGITCWSTSSPALRQQRHQNSDRGKTEAGDARSLGHRICSRRPAETGPILLHMLDLKPETGFDFPDDPWKWDGWSKYRAASPYERLCFAPNARPNEEQILQHASALMRWWQRK